MRDSFAAPRRNVLPDCVQLVAQGKILSAIDEIEAFADSSDEKILLNLSAGTADRFRRNRSPRPCAKPCPMWNQF